MADRPSFEEMRLQVALADGVAKEARVELERADGRHVEGTLRHGVWTEDLQLSKADPRDACIRITTLTGLETTIPWAEALELLRTSMMHIGKG